MAELAEPVLVTGGGGMIGANLVRRLVREGGRPAVLVRGRDGGPRLSGLSDRLRLVPADLTDAEAVERVVRETAPRTVFHLASSVFNPPGVDAAGHMGVNAMGTLNLLEALRPRPGVRIVFAGSAAAYGDGGALSEDAPLAPGTLYGASKAAAALLLQTYARLHAVDAVELRLFTPFGPWERASRLIPATILSALAGRPVRIGPGRQQRDYLFVDDVVEALLLAAQRPLRPGSVFNICSGSPSRIVDVVRAVLRLMGDPVACEVGALPVRADEIWLISGDNGAAARGLGWAPRTPLDAGLERMIEWVRQNRDLASRLA